MMLLWLLLNARFHIKYYFSHMMVFIINIKSIGHFMTINISEDLKNYEVVNDIREFRENNLYRYIRHASIRNDMIVFCCELGENDSKLVIIKLVD